MRDLTPREAVIVALATEMPLPQAAAQQGLTVQSVDALARHFGWPNNLRQLKSVGTAILAGTGDKALTTAPDVEHATGDVPDDLDAVVDAQDRAEVGRESQPQPAAEATDRPGVGERAVLTMPLARLVDIDCTETVVAEAVVDVALDREQVLVLLMETEGNALRSPVRLVHIGRRLTPEGADAIRRLAALLDDGGAR